MGLAPGEAQHAQLTEGLAAPWHTVARLEEAVGKHRCFAASERGCPHQSLPWDPTLDHRAYDGGHTLPQLEDEAPRDTGGR